jgi:hypothetical protein
VTRLLDLAKQRGFTFAPAGGEGSSWLERTGPDWHDVVFLGGGHYNAVRSQGDIAPGESLFSERSTGTALSVLYTVTTDQST